MVWDGLAAVMPAYNKRSKRPVEDLYLQNGKEEYSQNASPCGPVRVFTHAYTLTE